MAEEAYPFDGQAINTELQWTRYARMWGRDGVDGVPGGTQLKVVATTGRGVSVAAGTARVRGMFYRSDAAKPLTLPVASANPRIDRIVLRVDTTTNTATPNYIQGTAASNPTPPAKSYTEAIFDLVLADVRVETNGTLSTIADKRWFIEFGMAPCTSTNRPDDQGRPLLAYEMDTGRVISSDGTNTWTVGFGDDTLKTSHARKTDGASTNSTDWTSTLSGNDSGVSFQFVAPPSGEIDVRCGAYIYNATGEAISYVTAAVSSAGGTVIAANGDISAKLKQPGAGRVGASVSTQEKLTGLVPGYPYVAILRYVTTSGEASYQSRYLEIQPLP